MRRAAPNPQTLNDLPVWRLIVALDDAERTAGAGSATARVLARALQERLAKEHGGKPPERQEVERATR
jgi:hypothetical protein